MEEGFFLTRGMTVVASQPSQYLVLITTWPEGPQPDRRTCTVHEVMDPVKVTEGFRSHINCDSQPVLSTQLESELETGHEHERAGQEFIPYAYVARSYPTVAGAGGVGRWFICVCNW